MGDLRDSRSIRTLQPTAHLCSRARLESTATVQRLHAGPSAPHVFLSHVRCQLQKTWGGVARLAAVSRAQLCCTWPYLQLQGLHHVCRTCVTLPLDVLVAEVPQDIYERRIKLLIGVPAERIPLTSAPLQLLGACLPSLHGTCLQHALLGSTL